MAGVRSVVEKGRARIGQEAGMSWRTVTTRQVAARLPWAEGDCQAGQQPACG